MGGRILEISREYKISNLKTERNKNYLGSGYIILC